MSVDPNQCQETEAGFAFLIVLPQILIAVVVSAAMALATKSIAIDPKWSLDQLRADLALEGGIQAELFKRLSSRSATEPIPRLSAVQSEGARAVEINVVREASKISLLLPQNNALARLAEVLCLTQDLTARVPQAGLNHEAQQSQRYLTLGAWRREHGLTREAFVAIRPYITVYGYHDRPNLIGAPLPVVMAVENLGRDTAEVRRKDLGQQTEDTVGVLTISSFLDPASSLSRSISAVVYFTGDPIKPFQILEMRRGVEREPAISDCSARRP